jgi:hypothetical protein
MIERKIALVLVAIAKVQLLCRFAEHHVILARQVLLPTMQRRLPFSNHSFHLMLYLEWILLGITLLGEIRPTRHGISATTLSLSILTLMGFGLMGLKLPTGKTRDKVLYTGLEFGLLFLAFLLDSRPDFFPLVGLIIVIRSCLTDYRIQLSQPIPPEIRTALYRIIQESLTNIYKHSAATQVSIHLLESPNAIQLQINDNGQGFNPERNTTGFGLQGMRERTAALGGRFFLVSQPGKGCQITVSIPLPRLAL